MKENIENDVYTTYELNYINQKEEFLRYILPVLKEEYGVGIEFEEKIKNIKAERAENLKKYMLKYLVPNPEKVHVKEDHG
ncbi:hypothetical protein [Clostridium sp. SGI.024]|uniref:hypothetical protein n=1 Tax=Clostridium sp. SGI.024 TaxID=3420551 RepID=UPI003CFFA269